MPAERLVGKFTCMDVLARLPAYVDGSLSAADLEDVKVHVNGCDTCARFGGDYAAVVKALQMAKPAEGPEAEYLADRLMRLVDPN